jgi:hypothetical protein
MSEPRIEDRPNEPDAGRAEAPAVARPAGRRVIWGVSAVVIGAFLVVDFITPYAIEMGSVALTFVLVGICIGEANLIAAWAVLAPGNLVPYRCPGGISPSGLLFDYEERQKQARPAPWPIDSWNSSGDASTGQRLAGVGRAFNLATVRAAPTSRVRFLRPR